MGVGFQGFEGLVLVVFCILNHKPETEPPTLNPKLFLAKPSLEITPHSCKLTFG